MGALQVLHALLHEVAAIVEHVIIPPVPQRKSTIGAHTFNSIHDHHNLRERSQTGQDELRSSVARIPDGEVSLIFATPQAAHARFDPGLPLYSGDVATGTPPFAVGAAGVDRRNAGFA
jgi:hypothetical protein